MRERFCISVKKVPRILLAIGALTLPACATPNGPVLQDNKIVSWGITNYEIEREAPGTFKAKGTGWGWAYTPESDSRKALGYMEKRGCEIKEVKEIYSSSAIKIEISNPNECLPELKSDK